MRRIIRAALALLLLTFPYVSAQAHPHVWIMARSDVLFDTNGRFTGVQHSWTFDPAYSAFAVLGLDNDGDGKPDTDKLTEMAKSNIESIQEFGYFTAAKINGGKAEFDPPRDYVATYSNSRVTLHFVLPLRTPVKPKVIGLQIDDPSFFVAFTLEQGADAVRLAGTTSACAVNIRRPAKAAAEGVQLLADEIANALQGKLGEGSSVTADYKGSIIIACP
jgi:ABC-type uncharacterized transport system substrate-binding protein